MASTQGAPPLLYPIEKGDTGYLASHQETSFRYPDTPSFSKRLLRGLTLLLQKDPVGLTGFQYKEIIDTLLIWKNVTPDFSTGLFTSFSSSSARLSSPGRSRNFSVSLLEISFTS